MAPSDGRQPVVVGVAGGLLSLGAVQLGATYGPRHGTLLLVGAACGLVLYHAAYGFATAFRGLVTGSDGRGLRAQMLMLAVATVLFAPLLATAQGLGRPVIGAVAPVGLAVLVGAFLFGVGMQLGDG